jgi:phage repressor protein C with HTH and peptisase S24 domain
MPKTPTKQSEHIAKKVQWVLSREGVTPALLGLACGVKSQSVYDWRDYGRVAKKHLPTLAQLSGTSDRWWLTPEAPIPPSGEWLATTPAPTASADSDNAQEETLRIIRSEHRIPVVGTAKLGDDGHFCELDYPVGFGDGYINLPSIDPHAYALRCRGDSMAPRIKNGEFVVVNPSFEVKPGDEVLVKSSDGRVMVKQYLYRRDGRVHLLSVNESHPSLALDEAEIEAMHYVYAVVKSAAHIQE